MTLKQFVHPTDIFEKDPKDIAENSEDIARIVTYYRDVRANIREVEAAGKRVTKKTLENPNPIAHTEFDLLHQKIKDLK